MLLLLLLLVTASVTTSVTTLSVTNVQLRPSSVTTAPGPVTEWTIVETSTAPPELATFPKGEIVTRQL